MPLIILLSLAALILASAAGFFSVVGLATTFAGSFWAVVALGSSIEFGKLVAVSFLYRFWSSINLLTKTLLTIMVVLVMFVTSFGVFGFLTKANQMDMIELKQSNSTLEFLISEEKQLQTRKVQIDQQVSQLKDTDVAGRVRLSKQFATELTVINKRLPAIAIEKQKLASTQITQQADVGPMIYLAKTFGYDVDVAVTWFTILLVLVFDPLAVLLTICTNIAIARRKSERAVAQANEPIVTKPISSGLNITVKPNPKLVPLGAGPVKQIFKNFDITPTTKPLAPVDDIIEPEIHQPVDFNQGPVPTYTFAESNPELEPLNIPLMQADWTHFSNKIKSDEELDAKIAQLQQYINDLSTRVDPLTSDEQILKERIIAFIQRKQTEQQELHA